jgi:hypothetical protein
MNGARAAMRGSVKAPAPYHEILDEPVDFVFTGLARVKAAGPRANVPSSSATGGDGTLAEQPPTASAEYGSHKQKPGAKI